MSTSHRDHGRLAVLGLIAALAVSILPGSAVQPVLAVSPDIVISQVYGGGGNAGATYTHDYIELFNRGERAGLAERLVASSTRARPESGTFGSCHHPHDRAPECLAGGRPVLPDPGVVERACRRSASDC